MSPNPHVPTPPRPGAARCSPEAHTAHLVWAAKVRIEPFPMGHTRVGTGTRVQVRWDTGLGRVLGLSRHTQAPGRSSGPGIWLQQVQGKDARAAGARCLVFHTICPGRACRSAAPRLSQQLVPVPQGTPARFCPNSFLLGPVAQRCRSLGCAQGWVWGHCLSPLCLTVGL